MWAARLCAPGSTRFGGSDSVLAPFRFSPVRLVGRKLGIRSRLERVLQRMLVRLGLIEVQPVARVDGLDEQNGVLLPFPIRGEALLVRLADVLRDSLMCSAPGADPFLLTLSRVPRSRLSIDGAAYVEFHAETATFQLTVETGPDSRMTLETGDFDTLVKFVVQYIAEKRRDPDQLEVAS
jgi:hypothetical protein